MDPGTFLVAEQVISTTIEGAALASIGIAQKTLPLSATLTRISSPGFLPRSAHTVTVINDHAYIFGGTEGEESRPAGNEVHIIALPLKSKGTGEPDYKCVPALGVEGGDGSVPDPRSGHSACAIGERIFVFGGKGWGYRALQEKGRVWVFDTTALRWSFLDPSGDTYPKPRLYHGGVGSERPLPPSSEGKLQALSSQIQESVNKSIPSLVSKPAPPAELHGTLFISSGFSPEGLLDDNWVFNIASKTWSELPPVPSKLPTIPRTIPSLAIATDHLYLIGGNAEIGSEIHQLSIPKHLLSNTIEETKNISDPPISWLTIPFPTNPLTPGPRPRQGAGFLPITTGNGRFYLLYFFGQQRFISDSEGPRTYWSDIFSYQPPASSLSPASIKDSTRTTIGIETGEGTWAEVDIIANEERGGKTEGEGKSHPGPRGWFGSDVIGGAGGDVVFWGGLSGNGETQGDGWIISVK